MKPSMEYQHQSQDSRQSLAEQLMAQFEHQADIERRLAHEEAQRQLSFRDAG